MNESDLSDNGAAPYGSTPLETMRVDWLIVGFAALGGLVLVGADVFQRWIWNETIWFFNIDGRFNPETWFHSFILAGAAIAAFTIALTHRAQGRVLLWLALGVAFMFLSMDKSISLHERIGENAENALGWSGEAGRLLWGIIYAPFLAGLVALLVIGARRAGRAAQLWIYAGIVLCGAKVIVEMLMFPAVHYELLVEEGTAYGIEVIVEESVQLMGFAAFFGAFAQLAIDRVLLVGRGELAQSDAVAVDQPLIPALPVPFLRGGRYAPKSAPVTPAVPGTSRTSARRET